MKDTQWKSLYRIGAISTFLAVLIMLAEIFLTALPEGARVELSIEHIFEIYNRNRFMAMRNMGLVNVIASTVLLPVFFSLFGLYREISKPLALFALFLSIAGYSIFMADNASFAFLGLANRYLSSDSESGRAIILAAGEVLFAKGGSHTPGTFPGFFFWTG